MSIRKKLTILSAFILGSSIFAHSSVPSLTEKKISIYSNKASYTSDMKFLKESEMDVLGIDFRNKIIDALVSPSQMDKLSQRGIQYKEDLEYLTNKAISDDYLSPDEVEQKLKLINKKFPNITKLSSIGKSLEGRDIWAIKISDNVEVEEAHEPAILFNGMHHAREVMTPEVTMDIVEYLTSKYAKDEDATNWINKSEIWVVPMLNVDGNAKVWEGKSMWRKNTRGGHGVDLNRNYPGSWGSCNGSSRWKSSQTYRGPSAGSEPETKVLMNLVSKIRPVFNISYHSYGGMVIYPKGCKGQRTNNPEIVENIGKELGSEVGYIAGTAWEILYSADGSDIDWMYESQQVIPFVLEVGTRRDGFQPNYSTARDRTVLKNRKGWMFLLNRLNSSAISGVDAQETKVLSIYKNDGNFVMDYKINPDGSYHVILPNGKYKVFFDKKNPKVFNL